MKNILNSVRQWPTGIRFYIALASVVSTAEIYLAVRATYGISGTTTIRTQQIYAWISLSLILVALSIGPVCKALTNLPGKAVLRDARRMIGVSAAWFAAWHVGISYLNQFHAAKLFNLPGRYQLSFGLGIAAIAILIALSATSFDAALKAMGIWWFRLHRSLYIAVLLILLHAFLIGSHAVTLPFLAVLSVCIILIFAMHIFLGFGTGREPTRLKSIVVTYGLLATIAIFVFGYSQYAAAGRSNKSALNMNGANYGTR